MQKINYQKELDALINNIKQNEKKPSLLLHACCAPCSSYTIEYLSQFFEITIFYYNPNIYPKEEYERRLEELKNFLPRFDVALKNNIKLVVQPYLPKEFFDAIQINLFPEEAEEKEKGERCRKCYKFRLEKSFEYAKENNFDYFCTTLSISPFKDAEKINRIGKELSSEKTKWLPSDFKKNSGFKRSLELSRKYSLYRQDYCGCVYSMKNSMQKKRIYD